MKNKAAIYGVVLAMVVLSVCCRQYTHASEFKGKIAKRYEDSKEWWPPEVRPPEGAPNVLIIILDDVE